MARALLGRRGPLLALALVPALVLGLLWVLAPRSSPDPSPDAARPAATPAPSYPAVDQDPARRTYAVALPALRGLPQDAPPGTRLELWVAWERSVRAKGRIQRLVDDVVLVRIAPPALPDAPPAALLSVPVDAVGDVLYGDLYGRFAVTIKG